jgi:hypothetical protein
MDVVFLILSDARLVMAETINNSAVRDVAGRSSVSFDV